MGSLFRYLWRTSKAHTGGREDVVTTSDVQTALGHLPPRMKHLPASVLTQLQEERKKVEPQPEPQYAVDPMGGEYLMRVLEPEPAHAKAR